MRRLSKTLERYSFGSLMKRLALITGQAGSGGGGAGNVAEGGGEKDAEETVN